MHLDQKVIVICTDNDTRSNGKIIRILPNGIDIEVSGTIIKLKKTKPNLYVGSMAGLEFIVKTWIFYSATLGSISTTLSCLFSICFIPATLIIPPSNTAICL